MSSRRRIWMFIALAAVIAVAGGLIWKGRAASEPRYRTQTADLGSVEVTVSATGTIQPVEQVEVGSQVSGTIAWLGADFNDEVKKGQVLAQLEPSLFRTAVAQAEANLARAQAALDEARRSFTRSQELRSRNVIAQVDLDAAEASFDQRRAEVKQAQASLQSARVNLGHATITSPINGVVIARAVDTGQTVASAMSAPRLYQIAGDLTRMQVETKIDEADIGRVQPDLLATFTVDAFPEDTFEGTVRQVRFEPVTEQNVVTYTTVIDVANPDLKLKPGMTANVTIRIEKKDDVLRVPNSALRFKPADASPPGARDGSMALRAGGAARAEGAAESARGGAARAGRRRGGPGARPDSAAGGRGGAGGPGRRMQTVYVLGANGKPAPVKVLTGITDGTYTEVRSRELDAGQEVVVGTLGKNGPQQMSAPPGLGGRPSGRPGGGGRRF